MQSPRGVLVAETLRGVGAPMPLVAPTSRAWRFFSELRGAEDPRRCFPGKHARGNCYRLQGLRKNCTRQSNRLAEQAGGASLVRIPGEKRRWKSFDEHLVGDASSKHRRCTEVRRGQRSAWAVEALTTFREAGARPRAV